MLPLKTILAELACVPEKFKLDEYRTVSEFAKKIAGKIEAERGPVVQLVRTEMYNNKAINEAYDVARTRDAESKLGKMYESALFATENKELDAGLDDAAHAGRSLLRKCHIDVAHKHTKLNIDNGSTYLTGEMDALCKVNDSEYAILEVKLTKSKAINPAWLIQIAMYAEAYKDAITANTLPPAYLLVLRPQSSYVSLYQLNWPSVYSALRRMITKQEHQNFFSFSAVQFPYTVATPSNNVLMMSTAGDQSFFLWFPENYTVHINDAPSNWVPGTVVSFDELIEMFGRHIPELSQVYFSSDAIENPEWVDTAGIGALVQINRGEECVARFVTNVFVKLQTKRVGDTVDKIMMGMFKGITAVVAEDEEEEVAEEFETVAAKKVTVTVATHRLWRIAFKNMRDAYNQHNSSSNELVPEAIVALYSPKVAVEKMKQLLAAMPSDMKGITEKKMLELSEPIFTTKTMKEIKSNPSLVSV